MVLAENCLHASLVDVSQCTYYLGLWHCIFCLFFIVKGENTVSHVRSRKLPGIAVKSSKATFIKLCNDKY